MVAVLLKSVNSSIKKPKLKKKLLLIKEDWSRGVREAANSDMLIIQTNTSSVVDLLALVGGTKILIEITSYWCSSPTWL